MPVLPRAERTVGMRWPAVQVCAVLVASAGRRLCGRPTAMAAVRRSLDAAPSSSDPPGAAGYFAVHRGLRSGVVVSDWASCAALVNGYRGAVYRKFRTAREAAWFAEHGTLVRRQPPARAPSQRAG